MFADHRILLGDSRLIVFGIEDEELLFDTVQTVTHSCRNAQETAWLELAFLFPFDPQRGFAAQYIQQIVDIGMAVRLGIRARRYLNQCAGDEGACRLEESGKARARNRRLNLLT
jgi:hypothetical protein